MSISAEMMIASRLIRAALDSGYLVSVWDGEDYAVVHSDDKETIIEALGSTDEDMLMFYRPGGTRKVGWVLLVWGNGEEIISDSSTDEATCKLCDEVNAWVERQKMGVA